RRTDTDDLLRMQQLFEVELKTHTEHQKDDAELGELACDFGASDEARREGSDDDSCDQVTDDRRQAKLLREDAKDERGSQRFGNGDDELDIVHVTSVVTRRCFLRQRRRDDNFGTRTLSCRAPEPELLRRTDIARR